MTIPNKVPSEEGTSGLSSPEQQRQDSGSLRVQAGGIMEGWLHPLAAGLRQGGFPPNTVYPVGSLPLPEPCRTFASLSEPGGLGPESHLSIPAHLCLSRVRLTAAHL